MPHLTQLLSIELGTQCNLGRIHTGCPNCNPERYAHLDTARMLNDGMIVNLVKRFYDFYGFAGLVAWHYYQEPLVQAERMFRLMVAIKATVPRARFCLWTNGTLVPGDCSRFGAFEQIHVTDYTNDGHPPKNLDALRNACRSVSVHSGHLDGRLIGLGGDSDRCCRRIFTEFIVDHFGNVHPCCYDWRGLASPGNIFTAGLDKCVQRWRLLRASIAGERMTFDAPAACRKCQLRTASLTGFVPKVKLAASRWKPADDLPPSKTPNAGRPAVVFVFYRNPDSKNPIPLQRLADHFDWNDDFYADAGCRVFVVTDSLYDVPPYAECLVYPHPMPMRGGKPVFSLTRTKNHGIQAALDRGYDPIVVSDVDMAYTPSCWRQLLSVDSGSASIPVYWMAPDFDHRNDLCPVHPLTEEHAVVCHKSHQDHGATGTISMTAHNWRRVKWDDRCIGYGADDGIIQRSIVRARITKIGRPGMPTCVPIFHIAHVASAPQVNFSHGHFVRQDAWDSDFNPVNFKENQRYFGP